MFFLYKNHKISNKFLFISIEKKDKKYLFI